MEFKEEVTNDVGLEIFVPETQMFVENLHEIRLFVNKELINIGFSQEIEGLRIYLRYFT